MRIFFDKPYTSYKLNTAYLLPFAILLAIVLLSVLPKSSSFESEDNKIVYAYFLEDPASTIHISWISSGKDPGLLEFKRRGSNTWTRREVTGQATIPGSELILFEVHLENLRDDATYDFRLGNDSSSMSFRTLPRELDRPISFVNGGDMYHAGRLMIATTSAAAKKNPYFAVIGGDWAYADGNPAKVNRWFELFEIWQKEMVTPGGHLVPFVPAIGNHEVQGGYSTDASLAPLYFTFFNKPDKRAYYTLDVGTYLSIIALDTNHTNSIGGIQTDWLQQSLSDRVDVPHVFPVYHVAAWPSHRPVETSHSRQVRQHWVPLFERHGVALAFENHDHTFKRTKPIKNNQENPSGVVYIGDGSWGVDTRPVRLGEEGYWYLEKASADHHFWHITLSPELRVVSAYNEKGKLLDSFTQETTDQHTYRSLHDMERAGNLLLAQNYPNPFNSSTQIPFYIPERSSPAHVKMDVYNLKGQRMATLINGSMKPGIHYATFDTNQLRLSSGMYLYRLQFDGETLVRQMQLLK